MSRREAYYLRIVEVREGRQCARERRWKQHISHHVAINRFPIKRSQRAAERRLRDYIKNVHYNFVCSLLLSSPFMKSPMSSANLALCLHVIEYQHWLRKKLCHSLRRGHKSHTFFFLLLTLATATCNWECFLKYELISEAFDAGHDLCNGTNFE